MQKSNFDPIVIPSEYIRKHYILEVPQYIKNRHIKNIKRYSGNGKSNAYYKYLYNAKKIINKN